MQLNLHGTMVDPVHKRMRAIFLLDPSESSLAVVVVSIVVGALVHAVAVWLLGRRAVSTVLLMGQRAVRDGGGTAAPVTPET